MTASSDLPQQEMAPVREESIVGSYFAKLTTLLESEEDQKQTALMFAQRLGSKYFIAILQTLPEIDRVERRAADFDCAVPVAVRFYGGTNPYIRPDQLPNLPEIECNGVKIDLCNGRSWEHDSAPYD